MIASLAWPALSACDCLSNRLYVRLLEADPTLVISVLVLGAVLVEYDMSFKHAAFTDFFLVFRSSC